MSRVEVRRISEVFCEIIHSKMNTVRYIKELDKGNLRYVTRKTVNGLPLNLSTLNGNHYTYRFPLTLAMSLEVEHSVTDETLHSHSVWQLNIDKNCLIWNEHYCAIEWFKHGFHKAFSFQTPQWKGILICDEDFTRCAFLEATALQWPFPGSVESVILITKGRSSKRKQFHEFREAFICM